MELATMNFRKHQHEAMLTRMAAARYDSGAAWREEAGNVSTDLEYWINESVLDRAACIRVRERIGRVEELIINMEKQGWG
ncbi:MAG: hypothetical protein Q7T80_16545 [Methanoregula sp.]|nr:hypothetical protein [Methanoregula sp.]